MSLAGLFAKYSLSGVVNTIIGYVVIFTCMPPRYHSQYVTQ